MKIAVTSSESKTQYYINQAYVDYLIEAGFEPVIVTPKSDIILAAAECDGLLLPGGIDIDPIFYGEDNVASISAEPEKDKFERSLFYAFIAAEKPIFGICRGFQLIVRETLKHNPHNSLSFWQNVNNHSLANDRGVARTQPTHSVTAFKDSLYGEGPEELSKMFVNSMHHQALVGIFAKNAGPIIGKVKSLAVTSFGMNQKAKGLIIEAADLQDWGTQVRGVQWHPEELMDVSLLHTFFGEAFAEQPNNKNKGVKNG